ncbi:DUF6276 family protein [Haloparvum sp. PAK95]|uniref:DUF6276 family protein n=1 Tax=Haloparvum sp. PAK95 TaxID=3418962 RepID=UPI003D2F16C7
MHCPDCGGDVVAFAVPPAIREHAPADEAAICVDCLAVHPVTDLDVSTEETADATIPADADFSALDPACPGGRAGVAFALALGKLDSLALNREAITELLEYAETAGADVFLALDRLEAPAADVDLDRRAAQLRELL